MATAAAKTDPKQTFSLAEAEKLVVDANKIAAEGKDRDGALVALAKGMADGMSSLVALVKGMKDKPAVDEDPDEDEEKKGGGDPDEDPDEDEKKGPGFEDMKMGNNGNEEFVDATEFVLALQKSVDASAKEVRQLRKELKAAREEQRAFMQGVAATLAPLSKGVLDVNERLLDLPGVVHNPGLAARRAAVRHGMNGQGGEDGAVTLLDSVKLSKALSKKLITEDELRFYRARQTFPENAETLIKEIAKL